MMVEVQVRALKFLHQMPIRILLYNLITAANNCRVYQIVIPRNLQIVRCINLNTVLQIHATPKQDYRPFQIFGADE
jgi:hypothetical protein